MQTMSDIPELVRCFKYNPPPRAQGKSASQVCHLVMELMEVGLTLSDAPSIADCIAGRSTCKLCPCRHLSSLCGCLHICEAPQSR